MHAENRRPSREPPVKPSQQQRHRHGPPRRSRPQRPQRTVARQPRRFRYLRVTNVRIEITSPSQRPASAQPTHIDLSGTTPESLARTDKTTGWEVDQVVTKSKCSPLQHL